MQTVRFLTAGELCQVLGKVPYQTLNGWVKRGEVQTMVPARGIGRQRLFSFVNAFAASVRVELAKELPRETAQAVADFLAAKSQDELEANFAAGRRFVMVAQGCVCPVMGSRDELYSEQVAADAKQAAAEGINVQPTLIDLRPIWHQVKQRIERLN